MTRQIVMHCTSVMPFPPAILRDRFILSAVQMNVETFLRIFIPDESPTVPRTLGPRPVRDQVWPTAFYSVVGGRKKDLIWRLDRD